MTIEQACPSTVRFVHLTDVLVVALGHVPQSMAAMLYVTTGQLLPCGLHSMVNWLELMLET